MTTTNYHVRLRPELMEKANKIMLDALLLDALAFRCKSQRSLSLQDLQFALMGGPCLRSIMRGIERLEANGHIEVVREAGKANRYAIENQCQTVTGDQCQTVTPTSDKLSLDQGQIVTGLSYCRKKFKEHPLPPQHQPPAPPAPAEVVLESPPKTKKPNPLEEPAGFAEWYALYPKKVARVEAIKAYRNRCNSQKLKDLALSALTRELPKMRETDAKYVKNPASWLNAQNWLDTTDSNAVNPQYTIPIVENKRVPYNGNTRNLLTEAFDRELGL